MNKIIGLAGTFASGKDTLSNFIVEKHQFMHISTGDMIRTAAQEQFGNTERPTLKSTANTMRREQGAGVFVEMALKTYEGNKDLYPGGVIISGIRSIGEVEALHAAGGKLIFLDAPIELRYSRIQTRQRANEEALSFEQFEASEAAEIQNTKDDPTVQNLAAMKDMADIQLYNNGDIDNFTQEAEKKIKLS